MKIRKLKPADDIGELTPCGNRVDPWEACAYFIGHERDAVIGARSTAWRAGEPFGVANNRR
jgi:hypothetical protein